MTALLVLLVIIVLLVVGWAVLGLVLQLLWWALIGLVIGALARFVLPGRQPLGWLATILFGIGGALLGGVVARAIGAGGLVQFLIAVLAAAILISLLGGSRRLAV